MEIKAPENNELELNPGERRWAILSHASTFFTYIIAAFSPVLEMAGVYNLVTPWILQLFMRNKPFARGQAKEAFLFQIFLVVYYYWIYSYRQSSSLGWIWYPLLITGVGIHLVNFILAVIFVLFKKDFHYPFSPFYHFRKWQKKKYDSNLFIGKFDSKNQAEFVKKHIERLKAIGVQVKKMAATIKNPEVKTKISSISANIDKIILNFEKDPGDVNRYRQFLQYYPDATVKLLEKYQFLESSSDNPADLAASLEKVSSTLDLLKNAYEEYYQKLIDNDVQELNIETKMIEETLKYDNFGQNSARNSEKN